MKKTNIFFIIIIGILFINLLSVNVDARYWAHEARDVAKNITNDNDSYFNKTMDISNYLWEINNYTVMNKKQSLSKYWDTQIGDCTEVAGVKHIMYRALRIPSRIVHGYVILNKTKYRHDWVEYRNESNKWTTNEPLFFEGYEVKKTGRGIW